jgi:hypothetical protein
MYGFNPYVDQLDAINRIVAESGVKEAVVLRKLVDEALYARRRKEFDKQLEEPTSEFSASEELEAIGKFLSQIVRQLDTSYRMQDISLALIQDTLAEARAGRDLVWKKEAATLREKGLTKADLTKKFDDATVAAKDFAYGLAQDLKQEQDAAPAKSKQVQKPSS